jgi:hypothetical protein
MDEAWEVKQLIDKIVEFLKNKRYISMLYVLTIAIEKYFLLFD